MELTNFGGFNTTERAKWFDLDNDPDGARFLIAPNDDPELAVNSGYYGHRYHNKLTGLDPALTSEISDTAVINEINGSKDRLIKVYAENCLLDWENVTFQGKPFKYSKENCLKLLTNFPVIYNQIVVWSLTIEKEREEAIIALKKTSEQLLNTSTEEPTSK